jgi:hypothetical protein
MRRSGRRRRIGGPQRPRHLLDAAAEVLSSDRLRELRFHADIN